MNLHDDGIRSDMLWWMMMKHDETRIPATRKREKGTVAPCLSWKGVSDMAACANDSPVQVVAPCYTGPRVGVNQPVMLICCSIRSAWVQGKNMSLDQPTQTPLGNVDGCAGIHGETHVPVQNYITAHRPCRGSICLQALLALGAAGSMESLGPDARLRISCTWNTKTQESTFAPSVFNHLRCWPKNWWSKFWPKDSFEKLQSFKKNCPKTSKLRAQRLHQKHVALQLSRGRRLPLPWPRRLQRRYRITSGDGFSGAGVPCSAAKGCASSHHQSGSNSCRPPGAVQLSAMGGGPENFCLNYWRDAIRIYSGSLGYLPTFVFKVDGWAGIPHKFHKQLAKQHLFWCDGDDERDEEGEGDSSSRRWRYIKHTFGRFWGNVRKSQGL